MVGHELKDARVRLIGLATVVMVLASACTVQMDQGSMPSQVALYTSS